MHETTTTKVFTDEQSDRITVDEIVKREKAGEEFTYVDARGEKDWDAADTKIAGALRIPLERAGKQLADINKDKWVVTYCT